MNKINKTRNFVFVFGFLVGIIVILQVRSLRNHTIFFNSETLKELEFQVSLEKSELTRLEEYLERKRTELQELQIAKNTENLTELLEKQRLTTKAFDGAADFSGSGLKISVSDSEADILPTQNPNDFIVHDQDILRIVNDLKTAGAEVISINSQLYRKDSEIKCSGPTITINGKTFGQPFVIRAIGDPELLEAAIKSKDSYSYMISSLYGIKIEASREEEIVIQGIKNNRNYFYLKEAKE